MHLWMPAAAEGASLTLSVREGSQGREHVVQAWLGMGGGAVRSKERAELRLISKGSANSP